MCICRMPEAQSVVAPPSRCPHCHTRLKWYDLVPLASQILLRARCRYCRQPVSWRYFVVELITGTLFVLAGLRSSNPLDLATSLVLISCLIAIFYIDYDHFIIPDELSLTPAAVAVSVDFLKLVYFHAPAAHLLLPWPGKTLQVPVPTSVLGLIVGSGVLFVVGWIGTRMFHKESMGGGDVKLAGAVGACLGFQWHLLTFFLLSVILGAFVGIILIGLKKKSGKDYIPFGPMLVVGALVTRLWGEVVTPYVLSFYTLHSP